MIGGRNRRIFFRAHPRANLPVGQDGPRTGLSACIFFASGKKGYRFNPLRHWRIAMETAASMPLAPGAVCIHLVWNFYREVK
jgi:hypothetical protein